ncbi:hypothetical protein QAD02_005377 [Eretmocerus hayati]|uniref:Uncharacterized protein n=1 Tax=Eretmocerus hayati TaxID=131215 RepID=A0ACC2NX41_9HYME|nr:hypothetical protein QAD02_005377 [Eretmocerus hayati]
MFLSNMLCTIAILLLIAHSEGLNKYSKEANQPKSELPSPTSLSELKKMDKPFRMNKLNLIWTKAKHRLTDSKLQSIFSDLKIQDKEEIAYKHFKSDGKDETGLEEARLRKKLMGLLSTYGLLDHLPEYSNGDPSNSQKSFVDSKAVKEVFKDKRLNKLWKTAELGGFTHEELEVLKEEFKHHQDKVDEYMSLLSEVESGDPDRQANSLHEKPESWNELDSEVEMSNDVPGRKNDYLSKANVLKEKEIDIKSGYDNLEGKALRGSSRREFVEPKVQGLWKLAVDAKFSADELASLKEELFHYETRLLKLRHLHTEAALEAARKGKEYEPDATSDNQIKRHVKNVEKLHRDIEDRIMQKHVEL